MNNFENEFLHGIILTILIFICGIFLHLATEFMLLSITLILIRFVAKDKSSQSREDKN